MSSDVICGLGEYLQEERLANVVRTGAGQQKAARFQEFQRPQIDLFVAAMRCGDAVAIFRKCRWVQNHHLELSSGLIVLLQNVKCISFAKIHVPGGVEVLVALRRRDGRRRHVNALDVLACVGNRQSEAALIAEAIENFPGCVSPRRAMILALVEKGSGFLAFQQVVSKSDAIFLYEDLWSERRRDSVPTRCSSPSSSRTFGSLRSRTPLGESNSISSSTKRFLFRSVAWLSVWTTR